MTIAELVALENDSIRAFVAEHEFTGRVLDYGCGSQPYRDLVTRTAAEYVPFDRADYPANMSGFDIGDDIPIGARFDGILCTQMIQFTLGPHTLTARLRCLLNKGGHLVMTGPTCWPIVNGDVDLWRFTLAGVEKLITSFAFEIEELRYRESVDLGEFTLPIGWGLIARAT